MPRRRWPEPEEGRVVTRAQYRHRAVRTRLAAALLDADLKCAERGTEALRLRIAGIGCVAFKMVCQGGSSRRERREFGCPVVRPLCCERFTPTENGVRGRRSRLSADCCSDGTDGDGSAADAAACLACISCPAIAWRWCGERAVLLKSSAVAARSPRRAWPNATGVWRRRLAATRARSVGGASSAAALGLSSGSLRRQLFTRPPSRRCRLGSDAGRVSMAIASAPRWARGTASRRRARTR